jgi:hypothetical protein
MGHVAAQIAAWGRKDPRGAWGVVGNGKSTGSGPEFPQTPTAAILLSNGTWLDITTDVRYRAGVSISRGKRSSDRRSRYSQLTIQINNADGKYSPRNPNSPLSGLISRNTQIRMTNRGTIRFWGEVPEWPTVYTTGNKDAWVNLSAAGVLRRVTASQGPNTQPIASALTRAIGASSPAPAAWWTLEDQSSATFAGSGVPNGSPMNVSSGTVSFGSLTDIGGAARAPNTSTGSLQGLISTTITPLTGAWGFEFAAKANWSLTAVLAEVLDANGNVYQLITPGVGFPLQTALTSSTTSSKTFAAQYDFGIESNFDGIWHYYAVYFQQQSGVNVIVTLYVDGVQRDQQTVFTLAMGAPISIILNKDLTAGGANSAILGMSSVSIFNVGTPSLAALTTAYTGYNGEKAGVRIQRLCTENGIPFKAYDDLTNSAAMGAQAVDTLYNNLTQCEDADMGFLFEPRDFFGLAYKQRYTLCNQAAKLVLDHSLSGNVSSPLAMRDDDQGIINKSTVSRPGGSFATYEKTTGVNNSQDPPTGVGLYAESPQAYVQSDNQLGDVAGWHVNLGTVDEIRFQTVGVNVANSVTNHGLIALQDQAMNLEIGDRLTIDHPPVWAPPDQISQLMCGNTEFYTQFETTCTFDIVPESPYHIAILEDPNLSRLESDGTFTSDNNIGVADTSINFSVPSGPLWLQSATLPADFPFLVLCAGEVWQVTAIAGTGPLPQTATVVRSINGVVKTHNANEQIVLKQPMILG